MGRLVGFEPTTSRTTIWRYYQLSYSRHDVTLFYHRDGCRSKRGERRFCPPEGVLGIDVRYLDLTATTSISTNWPAPTSETTWTVERAGLLGWSFEPKNCV